MKKKRFTLLEYVKFLLTTQTNYTITYHADHLEKVSHDVINRSLASKNLDAKLLWKNTKKEIVFSENGCIIFDDTVLDKSHSKKIELARHQYSGNEKRVIMGIGVVTCLYYNPEMDKHWSIDYRIYDPDRDNKSKLDHVEEMLNNAFNGKKIPFSTVLVDSWYATRRLMNIIAGMEKIYYTSISKSRLVSRVDKAYSHQRLEDMSLSEEALKKGLEVHLYRFKSGDHVKLFRIDSKYRTDYVVTNDLSQGAEASVIKHYSIRWKIETMHRELKQLTGIAKCQCRKHQTQRNHIACAFLVWSKLKQLAYKTCKTVYELKENLLSNYMISMLKSPTIPLSFYW